MVMPGAGYGIFSQYPSVDRSPAYCVMPPTQSVGCVKTVVSSQRVEPVCVARVVDADMGDGVEVDADELVVVDELDSWLGKL